MGWLWLLPRVVKTYAAKSPSVFVPDATFIPAHEAGGTYAELVPARTVTFDPLPLRPASSQWLWPKPESINVEPVYTIELTDATIHGIQGWVVDPRGRIISDLFPEPIDGDWRIDACAAVAASNLHPKPIRRLEGMTASLLMPNHTNYFHWLWQGLTRFDALTSRLRAFQIEL